MSTLDDFDERMFVNDDAILIALSLIIKFVFKRDLTEDQISVMNELSSHISQYDDNTNTVCKKETNRIFIYKRDERKEYYEFLGVKIPFELADLLCYIECWSIPGISLPPTILFKSDLLVRRVLLNKQFGLKKAPAEKIELRQILTPFSFEKGVLMGYYLDIFTAEMIASHFFFNPKVVSPVNNEMIKASRIETDKTRSAYNNAKKILVIDESQKVKMYISDSKSEMKIDSWLNKSSVHEIDVTSATDDSFHRIMYLICDNQLSEDLEYRDYRIIAFS